MYKYHRACHDRYGTKGITIISSVQLEHCIIGVWFAIIIVLIIVVWQMVSCIKAKYESELLLGFWQISKGWVQDVNISTAFHTDLLYCRKNYSLIFICWRNFVEIGDCSCRDSLCKNGISLKIIVLSWKKKINFRSSKIGSYFLESTHTARLSRLHQRIISDVKLSKKMCRHLQQYLWSAWHFISIQSSTCRTQIFILKNIFLDWKRKKRTAKIEHKAARYHFSRSYFRNLRMWFTQLNRLIILQNTNRKTNVGAEFILVLAAPMWLIHIVWWLKYFWIIQRYFLSTF